MQLFRGVWVKIMPEERTDQFRYGLMSVESAEIRTPSNIPSIFFFARARSNECHVELRSRKLVTYGVCNLFIVFHSSLR